ncbi:MAG: efflux RND transporter periplasmic adaptor subunit [Acidobacteria bacterium]|nr:efflux RND transporter periplasmic adaptor subunit [Acidobacteriota bacterium]
MVRRLAIAGIVVVAIVVVATVRRAEVAGPTALVERGPFLDELSVRGEIRPDRSVVLSAPSSGSDLQIVQMVANGTQVRAGDAVVVFDPTSHERTLEQKESELKQALAELDRVRTEQQRRVRAVVAELEQARSVVERRRLDVTAADVTSRVETEKRVLALANAERSVAEMEVKLDAEREVVAADVALATHKVDKARDDVEDTRRVIESLTLRAPRDGMVSLLPNFRAGGPLSRTAPEFRRGDRAWFGAAIAELPDLSSVRMTLRVDEADRARLVVGGRARVRVDAVPDRELAGRVDDISVIAQPDFSTFPPVRNFDVVVALDESDARLRPGMSATARLELDRLDDALLVPASAVFERDGAAVVYVVAGRTTSRRTVTVDRRGRDLIAISTGVAAGERVTLRVPDKIGATP